MISEKIVPVLNCLLNRGSANKEETEIFKDKKHDDLVSSLQQYLNKHRRYLEQCHLTVMQALNDKGVDLLLTARNCRIGFQVKSHFDATEKDFARKVKSQFAESTSYDLDHYYVLFCCPMIKIDKMDLDMKVTSVQNELALFRNRKFTVYGPQTTSTLFRSFPTVTRDELLEADAITDDSLHDFELGYEHQPEVCDEQVNKANQDLYDNFGDEWFESDEGRSAYNSYMVLLQEKLKQDYEQRYLPTLPPEKKLQREELVKEITDLLTSCRNCKFWDDRSEYKLDSWLFHVPEMMIPVTSLPNLLKIRTSLVEYFDVHKKMDREIDERDLV